METFSALLALCVGNSQATSEFPSQRPVTCSIDVVFIYAWINFWVNKHEAGDLRCHRAHYDVIVMRRQGISNHGIDSITIIYFVASKKG